MDTKTAFKICSDNLANLPEEYKKWDTLTYYRSHWGFVKKREIRERISEENMAFDYLHSLYLWLQPGLTLLNAHKLLCVQSVAAIFEAVMVDFLCQFTLSTKENALKDEISRFPASKIREILHKEGILDSKWNKFSKDLFGLRNYVHLVKTKGFYSKVLKYQPTNLSATLFEFRNYMHKQYDKFSK